jgi:hypothetical protein
VTLSCCNCANCAISCSVSTPSILKTSAPKRMTIARPAISVRVVFDSLTDSLALGGFAGLGDDSDDGFADDSVGLTSAGFAGRDWMPRHQVLDLIWAIRQKSNHARSSSRRRGGLSASRCFHQRGGRGSCRLDCCRTAGFLPFRVPRTLRCFTLGDLNIPPMKDEPESCPAQEDSSAHVRATVSTAARRRPLGVCSRF